MSYLEAYAYVHCSCIVAGCAYIMHILCMRMFHDAHFVVSVALACMHLNIYACDYVSAVSMHTSKLPPTGKCCPHHDDITFSTACDIR